jgi:hypothetical protein
MRAPRGATGKLFHEAIGRALEIGRHHHDAVAHG